MFKGIGSFFNNMKIGGKLATGFGALVFLTLLVGAISYATNALQNAALANLRREQGQTQSESQIKLNLLAARQQEQSFLLRWHQEGYDPAFNTYITQNQQAVTDVLKAVADARAASGQAGTPEEQNGLTTIENSAKTYGTSVLTLASTLKDRGFRDSGLEGQFRNAAHDVEAALGVDFTNQAAGVTSSKADPKILVLYLEMRRNEKDYELRGDQQYIQATHDFNTKLGQAIQADTQFTPDQKKTLSTDLKTYIDTFDTVVQKDTDVAAQTTSLQNVADSITPAVDTLLTLQTQHEQAALDSYQTASSASRVAQIALSALAVATGVLLAIIISRLIIRQVREIDHLFRAAAVGDFGARANVLSQDELGQTAAGVNALLEQLTSLLNLAQVERASLQEALETLVTTASSAAVAEQAALSAQEGSQAVNDAMSAMQRIRTSTQEAGRITKRLGEASQEINEVVAIIEDLSDRTTVLALNASIQAAAAGDAGRGFSVVAEEVQRLAERATNETRRIENLVKTIQNETNGVVVSIDEATREVVTGSQLAQKAGEQMSRLNELVTEVAGHIQVVAERTTQQTGQPGAALSEGAALGGNGHANGRAAVASA